jgi:hypothetical protein
MKGYVVTVRKNFNFDEETAKHLEELAAMEGKTQTEMVREAIEQIYRDKERERKLAALDSIVGILDGKIGDIDAKEARRAYVAEKYGY